MLVVAAVAFAAVAGKLTVIQLLDASSYQRTADSQDIRSVVIPAVRGSILAANGDELVFSEMRPTIFADPGEITSAATEASALSPVLHRSVSGIESQLSERTTYVVLAPATSSTVAAEVSKLGLAGIGVEQLPVRYHPDGTLAAPLLGAIDSAGNGVSGLEYEYNRYLTGHPGKLVTVVDPEGEPVPGGTLHEQPAVPGGDVLTTIDPALQYQVQQTLVADLRRTGGDWATAVVENVHTGALLAVSDLVAGPNHTAVPPSSATALTHVYQPGSVAKLVTVSGALTHHVISPTTVLNIPPALLVNGTYIHDAEPHPDEQLSITGVLAQSSNIGATEIAQRLGAVNLLHYEHAYGFGEAVVPGFPGESPGIVPTLSQFSGTTLATLAFGEAQAVTPVQLVGAYAAIADGGVYQTPHVVSALVGAHGQRHAVALPAPHRVVPSWVASAMTPMFVQVVSSGTGPNAQVKGYTVAGKTGTSNIILPDGHYSQTRTDATFAGYYPAQHPELAEVVVVEGSRMYGAQAAAPAFSTIARDAILDLGIPSYGPQPPPADTSVPTINGKVDTALLGY
jgi:cell division protein FtsI (penicillin-binding protein 3)